MEIENEKRSKRLRIAAIIGIAVGVVYLLGEMGGKIYWSKPR